MSGNVMYYYLMSGLEADGSPRGSKSGGNNNNNNGNNQSKKNKDKKAKKPKYELTRSPAEVVDDPNPEVDELQAVVEAQANIVRELKSGGADHDQVAAAVEVLKALKAKLEVLRPGSTNTGRRGKKKGKKGQGGGGGGGGGGGKQGKKKKANVKGQTKLGMSVGKEEDFSEWFTQAITKAEMIEYYDVSGCYILRPWSFQIWERVQRFMDGEFASLGVENAYFPLFVSSAALTREKDHVEGFAPEVAWVTKSGESELPEPIAVRPTSETIIYPAFAKWIQSHAQLPMRVNQWCSVVRWEMKHCVPFLRSREFLWQEGHTAHATCEDADQMVQDALDVYARTYADLYAVPMIKGVKSEKEKFAGGFYTTTVEGIIPTNGRAIQAATSHNLGQNFAKMFDIKVENPNAGQEGEESHNFVWQTSWGFTTRSVGVMIMVHGDDKGLVLPPRVAPKQVVFVPIFKKDNYDELTAACEEAAAELEAAGVRCAVDARKGYKPGWKFNHWELKGVPVRIEIGARDLQNNVLSIVIRHSGEKLTVGRDGAASAIVEMLDTIHDDMLAKATAERDACLVTCEDWSDFIRHLDNRKVCLVPWCNTTECEEDIKTRSGDAAEREGEIDPNALSGKAKTLCIPYDQPEGGAEGKTCIGCGNDATCWVLLGRSY